MAKLKHKKKADLADRVYNKRKSDPEKKKLNPFEVHINREKVKVLGKKSKHDRGLPGVSRAKAIKKRKETLGTEMKIMNKSNTFIDRRIGEKNNELSAEDKMIARFAAERSKQHTKKSIYNLADNEVLTHRGQTLEQIEKFENPCSSDEEDDDGRKYGNLNDEFVADGHFGGGVLSKSESHDGAKSHKDLIEQLIAESKKRKIEKQKEKEQTLDLTEKLDTEWKDLQPVVFKKLRREEDKVSASEEALKETGEKESAIDRLLKEAEKKSGDYDRVMRELKFERRGTPSDALKDEEKKMKEERERLEKLERDRQLRMISEEERDSKFNQSKSKHRSAEDLDDNLDIQDEDDFMLAYDRDGNPLVPDHIFKSNSVPKTTENHQPQYVENSSEDDGEEGSSDDDSSDTTEKETTGNRTKENGGSDDDDETSDENDCDDGNDDGKLVTNERSSESNIRRDVTKNLSNEDRVSSSNDSNSDEEIVANDTQSNLNNLKISTNEQNSFENLDDLRESENETDEEIKDDSENITYVDFNIKDGESLKDLLDGKTCTQQSDIVKSLIKSHDPGQSENNKDLLSRLFKLLIRYIEHIFENTQTEADVFKSFETLNSISPHLYDLAHLNKVSSMDTLKEALVRKHNRFMKTKKICPDLDTLVLFKIVSLLYPTSDFKHPVTTPSLTFMSEILTHCTYRDAYSISRGLFVTCLVLEYTVLSKRLVPPAINFLCGMLFLAANTSILNQIQIVPPFRLHREKKILQLENECRKMAAAPKMAARHLSTKDIDDDFKIHSLYTSVVLLNEFFNQFNDLEAQEYMFRPHLQLLNRIDLEFYPEKMEDVVSEVSLKMRQALEIKMYTPLCRERKRPKALRMYEPDVQDVFTGSKSSNLSREKAESERLRHRHKREMKGALREIRRDKSYIASVKIRQKIHSDNVRKEKVKQIYKEAAIQQGELNKIKRGK